MLYGELSIMPISVETQNRVLSYWAKLVEDKDCLKLSSQMYLAIHTLHKTDHLKSDWLRKIETLLCSLGFSGIWKSEFCDNFNWLRLALKQIFKDLYIKKWFTLLNSSSSSGYNFLLFRINFERSKYLHLLPNNMSKSLLKFRTRNHKLPIENGRWAGLSLSERKCKICFNDVGDEYSICYVVSISVLKKIGSLHHITLKEQTP